MGVIHEFLINIVAKEINLSPLAGAQSFIEVSNKLAPTTGQVEPIELGQLWVAQHQLNTSQNCLMWAKHSVLITVRVRVG